MTSLGCKTVSKTSLFFTAVLLALIIAFFVVLMQWAKAVNAPSSSGLKGSAAAATGNNGTRICLLSLIDIEEDEEEKEVYNQEENVIICNPVSGVSDIGVDDAFLTVRNLAIDDILSNREAMRNNEWFIEYSDEWVEKGNHDRSEIITVPEGHSVATVDPSRVSSHGSIDPQHRRVLVSSLKKRRRRLSTTRGQRTVVVVAIDVSMSNTAIYNHVFGKSNSMKSQMHDCSQGEVNIIPHPEFPVINVRPDGDTSDYNFVDLYTNVLKDIKRQLGVRTGRSVTSTTDHLMLIVPDSIDRRPGELGWGATPGFFAGIIESLVPSAMTMLHEIGE